METIRRCDRCGGQGQVESALVSTDGTATQDRPYGVVWSGDLCGSCRQLLEQWLKPLPEGPQKRKQEDA